VKKILELIIEPNSRKRKEFSQTLSKLAETLQSSCSSLMIDESEDSSTVNMVVEWDSLDQKYRMLRVESFEILSGAIAALCDKVVLRLNGKVIKDDISKLKTL
jgi:hypothetical protein